METKETDPKPHHTLPCGKRNPEYTSWRYRNGKDKSRKGDWAHSCPECGRERTFSERGNMQKSIKSGALCHSCRAKKNYGKTLAKRDYSIYVAPAGRAAPTEMHFLGIEGVIRSPNGRTYKFKNLSHFVRENQHIFNDEDVKWMTYRKSKVLRCNAVNGLHSIVPPRKDLRLSWKGWTFVSRIEPEMDLLDRQIAEVK